MTRVEITGIKETVRALKKYSKKTQKNVNKAIHDAGFFIEAEVKESIAGRRAEPTSVDSGMFMRSIKTDNSRRYVSVVQDGVFYGKFLEHGTSRIRPRRHFHNTAKRNEKKVNEFVRKQIV